MFQFMLLICCVGQTCFNIIYSQLGEVCDNFFKTHSGSQPSQNIIDGYSGISYARFAKPFIGISFNIFFAINHKGKNITLVF